MKTFASDISDENSYDAILVQITVIGVLLKLRLGVTRRFQTIAALPLNEILW